MIYELQDLNTTTSGLLSDACRGCGWWQGHLSHWDTAQADAWSESMMENFGSWGKLALGDGQLLGMVQYGPAGMFPRTSDFPCGPVSPDAVLLTCGAVSDHALASVKKSLVTAVIADFYERQIQTVEAFTMDTGSPHECRFLPHDFLRDCGFYPVKSARGVRLMRLELGGVQPVAEPRRRRRLLERIKRTSPAPAPVAMVTARSADTPVLTALQSLPCRPAAGSRSATACGGHG